MPYTVFSTFDMNQSGKNPHHITGKSALKFVKLPNLKVCFCGFHNETDAFFSECPLYSASKTNLLSSAARIFVDRWSSMSKAQIISVFLFGSPLLSPKKNNDVFFHVQFFI